MGCFVREEGERTAEEFTGCYSRGNGWDEIKERKGRNFKGERGGIVAGARRYSLSALIFVMNFGAEVVCRSPRKSTATTSCGCYASANSSTHIRPHKSGIGAT
jgi:hypothetical protein